ncbi:Uncharacterised protein [Mycobacterium tuberculosis]|nr:Uncharacterised protein [Mycobacterium tuberculosis]CKU50283.1 Uncharacterised protein [Mycobacterium tuberculosis]CKU83078.1 Uncharacterised protein [Mycobacterium tuberculosis]CKV29855.1 Uncharacterised protein [Mycobacterium tuberculosis]
MGEVEYHTSLDLAFFHFVENGNSIFYWTFLNNWDYQTFCTKLEGFF